MLARATGQAVEHFQKNPNIYSFQLYTSNVCVRETKRQRDRERERKNTDKNQHIEE